MKTTFLIKNLVFIGICLFAFSCGISENERPPNIVIIYADDMGYGDLNVQNPDSKIPTPYLDKLAEEGMRFTDAHSSSGICSPSRYALLTGTYHWRRQHGIVGSFGVPFFNDDDITLPQVLKDNGYETACIGKWHLGWNWVFKNEPSGEVMQWGQTRKFYLPEDVDWTQPISGGPLDRGFDYYYGDGTINFPPYAWVKNDRLPVRPNASMDIDNIGYATKEGNWEFRPGPKVEGWNPYEVLPSLAENAVEYINNRDPKKPFFLYFALPSPHAPIIPNDEFDGKSEAGGYGDFMVQTDWVAGQVIQAIKDKGLEDNTIVIFSADNGPEAYAWERAEKYGHFSMGNLRGLKRDVWEGGHHVPFIVKWPAKIKAGSIATETISQVDLMTTLVKISGASLPEMAAPDSYDITPVLMSENYSSPLREATIHNTYANTWGIRKGKWLYINDSTGGHRKLPAAFKALKGYSDFETEGLLFDMEKDVEQRVNLFNDFPDKVQELKGLLDQYRGSESTVHLKK